MSALPPQADIPAFGWWVTSLSNGDPGGKNGGRHHRRQADVSDYLQEIHSHDPRLASKLQSARGRPRPERHPTPRASLTLAVAPDIVLSGSWILVQISLRHSLKVPVGAMSAIGPHGGLSWLARMDRDYFTGKSK